MQAAQSTRGTVTDQNQPEATGKPHSGPVAARSARRRPARPEGASGARRGPLAGLAVLQGAALVIDSDRAVTLHRQVNEAIRLGYVTRGLTPPRALVDLSVALRQVAEQFRAPAQINTGSGTDTREPDHDCGSSIPAGQDGLPVATAAALIGISESYLKRRLRGGHMAGDRSGPRGSWLVDAAAVHAEAARRHP